MNRDYLFRYREYFNLSKSYYLSCILADPYYFYKFESEFPLDIFGFFSLEIDIFSKPPYISIENINRRINFLKKLLVFLERDEIFFKYPQHLIHKDTEFFRSFISNNILKEPKESMDLSEVEFLQGLIKQILYIFQGSNVVYQVSTFLEGMAIPFLERYISDPNILTKEIYYSLLAKSSLLKQTSSLDSKVLFLGEENLYSKNNVTSFLNQIDSAFFEVLVKDPESSRHFEKILKSSQFSNLTWCSLLNFLFKKKLYLNEFETLATISEIDRNSELGKNFVDKFEGEILKSLEKLSGEFQTDSELRKNLLLELILNLQKYSEGINLLFLTEELPQNEFIYLSEINNLISSIILDSNISDIDYQFELICTLLALFKSETLHNLLMAFLWSDFTGTRKFEINKFKDTFLSKKVIFTNSIKILDQNRQEILEEVNNLIQNYISNFRVSFVDSNKMYQLNPLQNFKFIQILETLFFFGALGYSKDQFAQLVSELAEESNIVSLKRKINKVFTSNKLSIFIFINRIENLMNNEQLAKEITNFLSTAQSLGVLFYWLEGDILLSF